MSSAHINVLSEFISGIREGKLPGNITLILLPILCSCIVQYFVLGKAKRKFISFIPLIMVFFTSVVSELFYNGLISLGTTGSPATAQIIGSIYASVALLCYIGIIIGTAVWFIFKRTYDKKSKL